METTEDAIAALKKRLKEVKMEEKLGEYVRRVENKYHETRDTLLNAVGSGLSLVIVFHEIERGVQDLHRAIDMGEKTERIGIMALHLVELLQGIGYLVRSSSKKSHKASVLVSHALLSQSSRLAYHKVILENAFVGNSSFDFTFQGANRMFAAALVNLIDNAIYWLNALHGMEAGQSKKIWIGSSRDLEGPAIVIADTGPGLVDTPEEVVQPFFTRKYGGMGIGLYFANLAMKAHGGRLAFLQEGEADIPEEYKGLKIAMVFKGG